MIYLLFVFLWFVCGFFAYGACIADFVKDRGYSPFYSMAWAVFILGPLGLLIAATATALGGYEPYKKFNRPFYYGFKWRVR